MFEKCSKGKNLKKKKKKQTDCLIDMLKTLVGREAETGVWVWERGCTLALQT